MLINSALLIGRRMKLPPGGGRTGVGVPGVDSGDPGVQPRRLVTTVARIFRGVAGAGEEREGSIGDLIRGTSIYLDLKDLRYNIKTTGSK